MSLWASMLNYVLHPIQIEISSEQDAFSAGVLEFTVTALFIKKLILPENGRPLVSEKCYSPWLEIEDHEAF